MKTTFKNNSVYNGRNIYNGYGVYNGDNTLPEHYVLLNGRVYENEFNVSQDSTHYESTFKDAVTLPAGYEKLSYIIPVYGTTGANSPQLLQTGFELPDDFGSIFCSWKTYAINNAYAYLFSTKYFGENYNVTRCIAANNAGTSNYINIKNKASSPVTISDYKGLEFTSDGDYRNLSSNTYTHMPGTSGTEPESKEIGLISPGSYTRLYFFFIAGKDKKVTFTAIPCKHGSDYGVYDLVGNQFYTHSALTGA